jgi:hypothetical protein
MSDASDVMHTVGMLLFGEVECLGIAVGDYVIASDDIHHDELPPEIGLDLRANVALVNLPPPANDLFGFVIEVLHCEVHSTRSVKEEPRTQSYS